MTHPTSSLLVGLALSFSITSSATAITVLGTGTGALLGGDLTDPENDGVDTEGTAGTNFNWVNVTSSTESYFTNVAGGVNEGAFDIFDNKVGGGEAKYCCGGPGAGGWWTAVEFADPISLSHFTLASSNDSPGRDPDAFQVQGSLDGTTWTDIFTYNNDDLSAPNNRFHAGNSPFGGTRNQVVRFDIGADWGTPSPVSFNHFRLNVDSAAGWVGGAGNFALGEFEIFGVVQVPEPSRALLLGLGAALAILRRRR